MQDMTNKQKKLLIIEDDTAIAEDISEIFEDSGYLIYTAFDGAAGIQLATEMIPDLIICDITMPRANGYQVKIKLAENNETSGIPFIFLTANADLNSMRKAMDLGADDYVVKPVAVEILHEIVNKRINHINDLKAGKTHIAPVGYSQEDKIVLKKGKEQILTKVVNISVIKSLGIYTQVFLFDGKKTILKRSLKKWTELLPPDIFIKVHRNFIVNLNCIDKLETGEKAIYNFTIKGCSEIITSSQRYSQKIRRLNLFGNN
jgi:DNA-binding LytR/AlgR family response regulator